MNVLCSLVPAKKINEEENWKYGNQLLHKIAVAVHRIKIFFLNLSPITLHLFLELQHEKETILLHYALRVCARAAKKARGVVRIALSASVTFQNQNWTLRFYIFLTKLARAYFQDGIRTWLTNKYYMYIFIILYFIYVNVFVCVRNSCFGRKVCLFYLYGCISCCRRLAFFDVTFSCTSMYRTAQYIEGARKRVHLSSLSIIFFLIGWRFLYDAVRHGFFAAKWPMSMDAMES